MVLEPTENPVFQNWWDTWDQAELSALIASAMQKNTSIKEAQANLRYYRATAVISRSAIFPSISGEADGSRSHSYGQGVNNFGLALNGYWTLDTGGALADWTASKADVLSQEASLGDVQTEIAAQVATAYVNLRLSQRQVEVAEQNIETQKEALDIARWRYMSGLVESTDVDQAITSLEQTRASIPVYQANVLNYRNSLAVLTSRQPEEIGVLPVKRIPVPPNNLALSIPADTLRQRPAVRAAEQDVQAALARHTSAISDLLPSFTLTGTIGLAGLTIGSLGKPGTKYSYVLGTINLPIFNAGALLAQVEQRDAQTDAANARYEAALLEGVQAVEDALNDIWSVQLRLKSLKIAEESAVRAATSARQNYQAGLQDFTVVLTTQQTLLSVQESYAQAEASLAQAYISLYQAMGGGWKVPESFEKKRHDRTEKI